MASSPTSIVRSTLLTVAMRWTDRLIGLVSTLVLARLLLPQDFGIIAMAWLAISLADLLFDLGVSVTLIQNNAPTQQHYDTAWTLALLQATVAALTVYGCAPWAAQYFHEPRVEPVIQVLGLSLLLGGMENIGIVNFQKEMHFGQDFVFLFCKRFSGFAVTLLCAWLLQSYWALVIGTLAGRLVGVVCSYAMHPMRPRLSLSRWREILGVSQWLLARTSGCYFEGQLHRAVVGNRDSASAMGAYALAGDISSIPSSELLMPINRVLFPLFVTVKHLPDELRRIYLLAQSVQSLIAMPASAGLALVAPQIVPLMLGSQWTLAVPLVQILAIAYLASAMLSSSTALLLTLDKARALALFTWAQVALFAGLAFVWFPHAQALQIAWLRLVVSLVSDLALVGLLLRIFTPLTLHDMLRGVLRPLLASACMAAGLLLLDGYWGTASHATILVAKIVAGAMLYASSLGALWMAAGRPTGSESWLLGHLRQALNSTFKKERPCS